jgi:hypothetical protein
MGFGQEMRDFVAAAQAGQKMVGAADDAAYQKAKKKYLESQTTTIDQKNADTEGQGGQDAHDLIRSQINAHNSLAARYRALGQQQQPEATPDFAPGMQPTTPVPAVPAAPAAPQVLGQIDPDPAETAAGIPTQGAAVGGPIKHYASGGGVVADGPDLEDDADPDDPVQTAAVGGVPAPTAPAGPGFSPLAAKDAVVAGLQYGARHQQSNAGVIPTTARAYAHSIASGAHAAPLADMDKVKKAVDPEGKMGESTRNLAAIGAVYQWKMNKGDTDGAARAAFQMIQHYRVASQKYAAIASVAGQKGDIDTMTHAAMKAYANVPDGQNFHVVKTPDGQLQYTVTDDHGKVTSQGIEPPDKLAAAAMGFVKDGFDKSLMQAAGQPLPKDAPGPKPMKVGDKAKLQDQVDEAYKTQNPDVTDPNDPKKTNPKYSPDDQTLHKGAALRMLKHANNDMTPEEATQVATKIADPSIPDKGGFSPKKVDGGYEVSFGKRKTFVPEDDFDNLMAKRTELADTAKKAKDKADEDAKNSWGNSIERAGSAVVGAGKAAVDALKKRVEANDAKRGAVAAVPAAPAPEPDYSQPQP